MKKIQMLLLALCCFISQIFAQEIYSIEDTHEEREEYTETPPPSVPTYRRCLYRHLPNGFTLPMHETYVMNAFVNYGCNTGYRLIGSMSSVCAEGEWLTPLPRCEEEIPEVYCKPPKFLRGTYRPDRKEYSVGATVTFECRSKYYLSGSGTATCLENGKWDHSSSCKVGCEEPANKQGYAFYKTKAERVGVYFEAGQTITYHCSPGYRLEGAKSAKCRNNGRWSRGAPKCKEWIIDIKEVDGCPPPSFQNGNYLPRLLPGQTFYAIGSVLKFQCYTRYNILGSTTTAKCQKSGEWTAIPNCQIDECVGQVPDHGYITPARGTAYTRGYYVKNSKITLSCDVGYYAIGKPTAKCMDNGQWDAQLRCADGCIAPQIAHIKLSPAPVFGGNVYEVGHRVRFQCDLGYTTSVREAECKGGDKWDRVLPVCRMLTASTGCPMPLLTEGLVLKNPPQPIYPYKAQLEFGCKPGFRMVGSAVSICRKGHGLKGGLDPLPPVCNRAKCGAPGQPQNGRFRDGRKNDYYFEDTVYFVCDDKHIMSGSDHITCQADGQFNGQPPTCQPPSCKVECKYVDSRECQCDALCRNRNDCCGDFEQHCRKLFY